MPAAEIRAGRTGHHARLFTRPAAGQLHAFAPMDGLYPTRVIQRGQGVCERYALGHSADTRWISFSMAKSITAVLVVFGLHSAWPEPMHRPSRIESYAFFAAATQALHRD